MELENDKEELMEEAENNNKRYTQILKENKELRDKLVDRENEIDELKVEVALLRKREKAREENLGSGDKVYINNNIRYIFKIKIIL